MEGWGLRWISPDPQDGTLYREEPKSTAFPSVSRSGRMALIHYSPYGLIPDLSRILGYFRFSMPSEKV